MDEINGEFPQADVALVIGANDVTNPAARTDPNSPIYGMPILDVDKARTVMVIKRSMAAGFAGIDNPLYYLDKTLMLFGDAKSFVGSIVRELGAATNRLPRRESIKTPQGFRSAIRHANNCAHTFIRSAEPLWDRRALLAARNQARHHRHDEKKHSHAQERNPVAGVTPNSKLDKNRVSASAATMPMATPANVATIP